MSIKHNEFFLKNCLESDFHKMREKQTTEVPSGLKCKIDIVLCLVKEAFEKLKISLILPTILENPRVLQQYLKNTKYNNCLKLVQEFRNKRKSESLQELDYNDYLLMQIVDYFQDNYKILDVLPNWLDDIDSTEKSLLKAFESVYLIAQDRFKRSATADLAKEKRLHEVYAANEEVKQQIIETQHNLQTKELNRIWKAAAKTGTIKKLQEELAFIQYNNNIFVEQKLTASHRNIQHINKTFTAKQQELIENLNKARLNYKTKLNADLEEEKNIRDERKKLQLQLLALIKRYDQTIYEKHKEEMLLQEEYNKQKQETDIFLEAYEKEEAMYQELVCKREQEYNRLHEAKVLLFTHTRAAKTIQKWWKQTHKRMAKNTVIKAKKNLKGANINKVKKVNSKGKKQ